MIKQLINYSIIFLSFLVAFYLFLFVEEKGFEFICVLPLVFGLCYPFLHKSVENNKMLLFFPAFIVVAFLRYVVNPFLLCYTKNYFGQVMNHYPPMNSLHVATYLMSYELIACSFFILFFFRRRANEFEKKPDLVLTNSYLFYVTFILLALVFIVLNPNVIYFFSFGVWGMNDFELSSISPFAQLTIMFAITAKFVLFWVLLSAIKKQHDQSKWPSVWKFMGFIVTFVLGFIYYGGNRAQFLFSLITHLYIFIILFPNFKKIVITISVVLGMIVLSFITDQRNYSDYYSHEKGVKKSALEYAQLTSLYFGGITNVALGVEMVDQYSDINKGYQLFKDVSLPIVGLNKLISFDDRESTNTLFNRVFFNSKWNTSQILPSIAQGNFYGGPVLCVLIDFIQLFFVFYLTILLKKTNRLELVFIFNVVLFRFSLMFGQNIIQQINGIAMQFVLPMSVYWMNNRFISNKK